MTVVGRAVLRGTGDLKSVQVGGEGRRLGMLLVCFHRRRRLPYLALLVLQRWSACLLLILCSLGLLCVCLVALECSLVCCRSLLSFACVCPSYHIIFRCVDCLESGWGMYGGGLALVAFIWFGG